jgi:hypothetical protein
MKYKLIKGQFIRLAYYDTIKHRNYNEKVLKIHTYKNQKYVYIYGQKMNINKAKDLINENK